MLKTNPYRGSRVFSFSIASLFSEPSCIYIYIYIYIYVRVYLAGVNFVFDKGHVASSETASAREES